MKDLTSIEELVYRLEFEFWVKKGDNEIKAHYKALEKVRKLAKLKDQEHGQ